VRLLEITALSRGQEIVLSLTGGLNLFSTMITKLIPITVECHSGYKADEYPKYIIRDNNRIEVMQITDRWYQKESTPDFPASDYFKAEMADGNQWLIKHDLDNDKWYLVVSSH